MDRVEVEKLIEQLSAGFDALQGEYQKLFGKHSILERKLATAREQYNELAKLYRSDETTTPPLSLISSPGNSKDNSLVPKTTPEILDKSGDERSKRAANKVRTAIIASNGLRHAVPELPDAGAVRIWSGPAADNPDVSSSLMPSIAESPLEQDFTVEGKPSQLGCPFASMARKKLSSHAASVLSRYERNGSGGSVVTGSTPTSDASRVNGRESFSKRQSRRASMLDPIKAEICGMSDHTGSPKHEKAPSLVAPSKGPTEKQIENADVGVCPIRFLDQHSPEEVATYFEKHKHELPRSHEVCVMRYQSNEEQIKELDAKYGNLVSMIQGLGQKHKELLPEDVAIEDDEDVDGSEKAVSDEKIRKWANSVSAQAPEAGHEEASEERLPHFERPVRDIRVGESPSRPWGIHVPATYVEDAKSDDGISSKPAQVASSPPILQQAAATNEGAPATAPKVTGGKCPFDHTAMKSGAGMGAAMAAAMGGLHGRPTVAEPAHAPVEESPPAVEPKAPDVQPIPLKHNATNASAPEAPEKDAGPTIIINGPVFFGYSPADTIRILKESGLKMAQ
ncbi:hypothetical protein Slin15195_G053290 [Septoria linicola]|uniref:Uncharacterized protein n=1 Tax=Septoria linicola TaxID=215465 RepID=A0A9Q9AN40_9PEZI|nr:hypothetical protein Slin15195_G053290 [Septoria linicola]